MSFELRAKTQSSWLTAHGYRINKQWHLVRQFISVHTLKNITTLMTGTVIAVIIPIIAAPVSSRIFNAADYGILALYMAMSSIIGVIAYAHYQHGILLEKEVNDARQMVWFTLSFCLAVSILCAFVIGFLYLFTDIIKTSTVGLWYLFLPISIICMGINGCLLLWANRTQQYKSLATNRVLQSILTVVIQIGLGLLIRNETGLLVGFIGGQMISAGLLIWRFCVAGENGIGNPNGSTFKRFAIKYKGLLFFSTPSEFMNSLINQSPVFFLQKFAGISAVGNFNFSTRLLGLPQTLLSTAIVEIFRQKATVEYNNSENCRPIFVKTFKALSLISAIPFLLIFWFSPDVFAWAFGEQWREAGVIAQILGILYLFRFIISPLTYVYTIARHYKEDFVMHIVLLVVTIGSFYLANLWHGDGKEMILIYALSYSGIYLIYLIRSYQLSKR